MSEEQIEYKPDHDSEGNKPEKTGKNKSNGKSKTRKYIMFGVLGVLIIFAAIYGWNWYQFAQAHESTDNAQVEGNISPVIPRVDGYVERIYVDDNDRVSKGDTLVSINKDQYVLGVKKAKAGLSSAQAALEDTRARLATVQAQAEQAEVSLKQVKNEKDRQQRLFNDHSATQQKLDNATYAYQSAQAKYKVAQHQVKAAEVNLQSARANIEKEQSAVEDAQLQLSYTVLRAPIAGRVSKKNIEAGQYIRPGNPVMAIANDDDVWIVANFKEGQISQIKVGQPVSIEVDAYSDTTFKGKVQSIGGATGSKFALLPPDNASGNFVKVEQRIPVKIVFNDPQNPGVLLTPGMNAVPTVDVTKK